MVKIKKTRVPRPKKKTVKKKKTQDCSICMCEITDKATLPCKHTFCKDCIVKWSETSTTCPNCREPFSYIKHGRRKIKVEERRQRPDHEDEDEGITIGEVILNTTVRYIDSTSFQEALARDVGNGNGGARDVARVIYTMLYNRDSLAISPADFVIASHILGVVDEMYPERMRIAKETISRTWLSRPGGAEHPILL
tara:strand:- start:943 stop:1527 length:585 start_codon:yes stop_codon:yes gene_type:complete